MKLKKITSVCIAVMLALTCSLVGCGNENGNNNGDVNENTAITEKMNEVHAEQKNDNAEITVPDSIEVDSAFTKRDKNTDHDTESAVRITLSSGNSDGKTTSSSESVLIDGDIVTVTDEGVYILSGSLSDGQIRIEAEKTDKLTLILDGVSVHSSSSAAIYVKTADKVVVTLATGSENELETDGEYVAIDENNIDAAVFSKEDITFNGDGKLTVKSASGHGIVSKDDVKFTGGKYVIESAGHGISGKDRVYILNGDFEITSGKDAIHSENADDETLGEILIVDGKYTFAADGDGIDGGAIVQIEGGDINVTSGDGHENAAVHEEDLGGFGGFGGWGTPTGNDSVDKVSAKGIKSGGNLLINGGELSLDTADDGLHAGGVISVSDGKLTLSAGDDGIHSDSEVNIYSGEIEIIESYEGIEGMKVNVCGGKITLYASDDGINATGGTSSENGFGGMGGFGGFGGGMMEGSDEYGVTISGGYLYVNADGDGIDSNGYVIVSGGDTYVDGPTNSANGALDYATSATIMGGTFVAVGAAGMAENFGNDSTQGAILTNVSGSGKITLTNSDGDVLAEHEPQKSYSSILISAPGLGDSGDYKLTVGERYGTFTMNGFIYGSGMGAGGFGGGMDPGGMGPGGMGPGGMEPGGKGPGGRR